MQGVFGVRRGKSIFKKDAEMSIPLTRLCWTEQRRTCRSCACARATHAARMEPVSCSESVFKQVFPIILCVIFQIPKFLYAIRSGPCYQVSDIRSHAQQTLQQTRYEIYLSCFPNRTYCKRKQKIVCLPVYQEIELSISFHPRYLSTRWGGSRFAR